MGFMNDSWRLCHGVGGGDDSRRLEDIDCFATGLCWTAYTLPRRCGRLDDHRERKGVSWNG